jgi:lycopene beta-cyclase
VLELLREERGVLPIVLSGDPDAFWKEACGVWRRPKSNLTTARCCGPPP